MYRNPVDMEELSDGELWYINIHGVKAKRDVPEPFSATVKKNRREKYRKLKFKHDEARNALVVFEEVDDSFNERNDGSRRSTSEDGGRNGVGCLFA